MGSLSVLPMHIERSAICEDRRGKPYRTRAERGGKTLEGAGFAAARGAAILGDPHQWGRDVEVDAEPPRR